ncbi:MAG: lysine 5,6-aminomutase reactivase subunit KamB [Bacillota bacterium]
MALIELVLKGKYQSVSVVGMAKNVGKTVALNRLVDESAARGLFLGLTSSGRDGERLDEITRLPKPAIHVGQGALVATVESSVDLKEGRFELVEGTQYVTQLGRVLVLRARQPGPVVLVGPDTATQLHEVCETMRRNGAQLVLVDGAFDRVATAAPAVTQATILATGAALGHSMAQTVARTRTVVELFNLKRTKDARLEDAARQVIQARRYALIDAAYQPHYLDIRTALDQSGVITKAVTPDTRAIAFGGALPGSVIKDFAEQPKSLKKVELFVSDGTRVFVDHGLWKKFVTAGGRVHVLYPINLLAVTVNPYSPVGPSYQPREFLDRVGAAVAPLPVFDLVLGEAVNAQYR